MNYDEDVWSELAMKLLEGRVKYVASRYYIPRMERADLEQELRLRLWQQLPKYNHRLSSLNTWATHVLKNHARNLFEAANAKKRSKFETVSIDFCNLSEVPVEIDRILEILEEGNKRISDFPEIF